MKAALHSRSSDKANPLLGVILFLDADGSVSLTRTYAQKYSRAASILQDFAGSSDVNALARRSFKPEVTGRIRLPMTGHGKGFKKQFYDCAKIGKSALRYFVVYPACPLLCINDLPLH